MFRVATTATNLAFRSIGLKNTANQHFRSITYFWAGNELDRPNITNNHNLKNKKERKKNGRPERRGNNSKKTATQL